jgi:hypothetical protein
MTKMAPSQTSIRDRVTPIRGPDGSVRLGDDWRRWIAETLLAGHAPDELLAALSGMGCPPLLAKAEIEAAIKSPYLHGSAVLQRRIGKLEWLLGSYGKLAAIEPAAREIPRKAGLPADAFFRDHYARHRPVILTGLIDHWPAMARWSVAYFETKAGAAEIEAQTGRESDPAYEIEFERHKTRVPFRTLLARLRDDRATNDFYITANNTDANRTALAWLWDDIGDLPGYLTPGGAGNGFFWMGPRGTVTPFHHDLTNNLLIQIRGTKRITLVPSWATPRMANFRHCYSAYSGPEAFAALPVEQRPETSACTLGPGEALFIPVGWWHHVIGLETTIGLSFTNFARNNDFHSDYQSFGTM